MINVDYGMTRTLRNTDLTTARKRITAALKEEGFGVLTEIDVKETLKQRIDVDFRPYVILGACNPKLAHKALTEEPGIGLLLACNVVVTETDDGHADVSIIKPQTMFQVVPNDKLGPVAHEATEKLTRALEKA